MIDTSVFIALERASHGAAPVRIDDLPAEAFLSSIVLSELCVGVESASTAEQAKAALAFVQLLERHFPLLPFGAVEARTWARLFVPLRQSGVTIGARVLQIAASALAHGHSVMTDNIGEFNRVPRLDVIASPFR